LTFLQNLFAGAYPVVCTTNLKKCSLILKLQHTVFLILLSNSTTFSISQIFENVNIITVSAVTYEALNVIEQVDTPSFSTGSHSLNEPVFDAL
jgi:hypothetical protein